MSGIDRRVDDRDQHPLTLREGMRFHQVQLGEEILGRIGGRRGRRGALLHRIEIVRLRAEHARIGL